LAQELLDGQAEDAIHRESLITAIEKDGLCLAVIRSERTRHGAGYGQRPGRPL
jgi:hypothetical protein